MEKERKSDEKLNEINHIKKELSNNPIKEKKEENHIKLNNRKKLFTIKEKISILEFAKEKNISCASRYFNIPRTTINSWKSKKMNYQNLGIKIILQCIKVFHQNL